MLEEPGSEDFGEASAACEWKGGGGGGAMAISSSQLTIWRFPSQADDGAAR
eukprot:SAG31_NODE_385_length_16413_cov_265.286686_4_plen_51_part_00